MKKTRHPRSEEERLGRILQEFQDGFEFLKKYKKAVSIFGSSRCTFKDEIYCQAEELASLLVKDGFAIITGGGPGVMEAANKGAVDARGVSVGLNMELPGGKQKSNSYVKESLSFYYFFSRKVMLAFASKVYIFFPGGFGTLQEFFEMIMLVQTKKIEPIPIVLVNRAYWQPLLTWIEKDIYYKYRAIDLKDLAIYHLVDNAKEAQALIRTLLKK